MLKHKIILWAVKAMLIFTLPQVRWEGNQARYENIASDAYDVAFDRDEAPLYKGQDENIARLETLMTLLAFASYEGQFRRDVDEGRDKGVGDGGISWCQMQVQLRVKGQRVALDGDVFKYTFDKTGWDGAALIADRKKCFRMGLHMLRYSKRDCGDFSKYTVGQCTKDEPKSKARTSRGLSWFQHNPPPSLEAPALLEN